MHKGEKKILSILKQDRIMKAHGGLEVYRQVFFAMVLDRIGTLDSCRSNLPQEKEVLVSAEGKAG
jgi:hypothetical protein